MFIGLLLFFVAAAGFTALISPSRRADIAVAVRAPRSYVGVDGFTDADGGGATFQNVEPPGSPADKAGLVGGDIITSFDGREIKEGDDISELLQETPVGKTVDVVYIRDGETNTTKLTTVGKDEFDRLQRTFATRPEGRGRMGYDDPERVAIEGTKIFGVKLNTIQASLPADMAGLKEGDVIIKFGDVPIRTPDELFSRVRRAIPYSTVTIELMRGSEKLEIPVKIGKQS
jgi:serine protease Do